MNTANPILQTAKRIAELARRGEGGERVNAEKLLGDFMAKHALSYTDLESVEQHDYRFDAPKNKTEQHLVVQCITSSADTQAFALRGRRTNKVLVIEARLTPAQYAEASMKIAVMLPLFQEEQRTFFSAFVMANDLGGLGKAIRDLTEEEKEHYRRAGNMSMFVKRGTIHKALEAENK